jgi:hypothetical protein
MKALAAAYRRCGTQRRPRFDHRARLLKRDAIEMIEHLQKEIAARASLR